MISIKAVVFLASFCIIYSASEPQIPILGPVLDTITNASRGVINIAVDTVGLAEAQVYGVVDKIKDLFEKFRKQMTHEIIELGLPALEPLKIKHYDLDIKHEIGDINGTVDDLVIQRLSTFVIKDVAVKIIQFNIKLNLTFDHIDISGLYDVNAYIGDLFNVYGNGPFTATIYDVFTGVDLKLGFANKTFSVKEIKVNLSFKNMTCNFQNLMGGGENEKLFNKVIGELAPEAVDNLWPEIEPILDETLKKVGSEKLEKIDYREIMGLLT